MHKETSQAALDDILRTISGIKLRVNQDFLICPLFNSQKHSKLQPHESDFIDDTRETIRLCNT